MLKDGNFIKTKIRYDYDKTGRLSKVREGGITKRYIYGNEGHLERIKYRDGTTDHYDQDGNLIIVSQHVLFNIDGDKKLVYDVDISAVYKYDDYGNWTSRHLLYENEPIRLTERKIEYYK